VDIPKISKEVIVRLWGAINLFNKDGTN